MVTVKVKTLDGRNQTFTLGDGTTVNDFKQQIETAMNIPINQQRLIFQGKVLQDEKSVNDCGIDGNVVHLVPRPPPSAGGSTSAPGTGETRHDDQDVGVAQIDDNGLQNMVQSILAGMGDFGRHARVTTHAEGTGLDIHVNIPHSAHRVSLARVRQQYFLRVETQARALLRYLEDPIGNPLPRPDSEVLRQDTIYGNRHTAEPGEGEQTQSSDQASASAPDPSVVGSTEGASTATVGASSATEGASAATEGASSATEGATSATEGASTDIRTQPLPITALVDMMDRIRSLWQDAGPYLDRWQALLREDRDTTNLPAEEVRKMQSYYDNVSRLLHLMSHMEHNMSDFLVEFGSSRNQPPRHLLVLSEIPPRVQARINIDPRLTAPAGIPTAVVRPRPYSLDRRSRTSRGESRAAGVTHNVSSSSAQSGRTSSTDQPRRASSATRVTVIHAPPRQSAPQGVNPAVPNLNVIVTIPPGGADAVQGATTSATASTTASTTVTSNAAANAGSTNTFPTNVRRRTTIHGADGTVYMTASSEPHMFFEVRPDAVSVNSVSTHVIASSMDRQTPATSGAGATSTSASAGTSTTAANSGTTGAPPEDSGTGMMASIQVGGNGGNGGNQTLPRVLHEVLENALRSSLHATEQGMLGGAGAYGGGGPESIPDSGLAFGDAVEVDPYLLCHSRHYMEEGMQNSMATDSTTAGTPMAIPVWRQRRDSRRRLAGMGIGVTPVSTASGPGRTSNRTQESQPVGFMQGFSFPGGSIPVQNMDSAFSMMNSVLGGQGVDMGAFTNAFRTPGGEGAAPPQQGGAAEANPESAFIQNFLQGIMGVMTDSVRARIQGGQPNSTDPTGQMTLGDFVRQIAGSNLVDDSSHTLMGDLSNLLMAEWTVSDMVNVTMATDRHPLDRLRVPLQRLLRTRETEAGSREALIEALIVECEAPEQTSLITLTGRLREREPDDPVDPVASVRTLYRHHLTHILDLVENSPTDSGFGGLMMATLTRCGDEWLALMNCMTHGDGQLLHQLIRQTVATLGAGFLPSDQRDIGTSPVMIMCEWLATAIIARLQQISPEQRRAGEAFLLRRSQLPPIPPPQDPVPMETNRANSDERASSGAEFATPPERRSPDGAGSDVSFPESADHIPSVCDYSPCPGDLPEDPLIRHPNATCLGSGGSTPASSEGPEPMDTGAEGWQAVLPREWVGVVARDAVRTNTRGEEGRPFSDAYISGMPAKRRKLMLAKKEASIEAPGHLLAECVQQAVESVGLPDPGPTPPEPALTSAFRDLVQERLADRVATDPDFVAERFPVTGRVFRKKEGGPTPQERK